MQLVQLVQLVPQLQLRSQLGALGGADKLPTCASGAVKEEAMMVTWASSRRRDGASACARSNRRIACSTLVLSPPSRSFLAFSIPHPFSSSSSSCTSSSSLPWSSLRPSAIFSRQTGRHEQSEAESHRQTDRGRVTHADRRTEKSTEQGRISASFDANRFDANR